MTVSYGKGPKGAATRLHSQLVRHRARERCARCERHVPFERLQCAHIVRRAFSWTRTDESNAWALCAGCHRLVDDDVWEFMELVRRTITEGGYEALRRKAQEGIRRKFDWPAEVVRLKALLAELDSEEHV